MRTDPATWLSLLASPNLADLRSATLAVLLVVAAAVDLRTMRIPNRLTLVGAVTGLLFNAAIPWELLGWRSGLHGRVWAFGGMLVGIVALLPLYLLRVMGAGDVKLMGMVGAFVGLQQIVPAVLTVFVAGGIVALAWSAYRRVFRRTTAGAAEIALSLAFAAVHGTRPTLAATSAGKLPYGVSIAIGSMAWLAVARFATH